MHTFSHFIRHIGVENNNNNNKQTLINEQL
jgi:hypothetical protein